MSACRSAGEKWLNINPLPSPIAVWEAAWTASALARPAQEDIWPGLADCINTELRENNGWGEQTKEWGCDLRPYIRRLVDLVREAERFARAPAATATPAGRAQKEG